MRYLNISDSCVFLASLAFFMSCDPLHARRAVYSAGTLSRVSPERRLSLAQIFQIGHFPEFCHQPLCPCASGLSPVGGKYRGFRSLRHPLSPRFRRAVTGRRGPFPYAACPAASHRSVSLFLLPPSLNAPQRESCVVTASSPWRPRSCQLPPRADTRGLRSWLAAGQRPSRGVRHLLGPWAPPAVGVGV